MKFTNLGSMRFEGVYDPIFVIVNPFRSNLYTTWQNVEPFLASGKAQRHYGRYLDLVND
jgi:hypothetical protein